MVMNNRMATSSSIADPLSIYINSWPGTITSTSDQFCHGKTWQFPRLSVDIATSQCFFFRGNNFVTTVTTHKLRCKSDNVQYLFTCLRRGYSDGPAWIQRRPGVDIVTALPKMKNANPNYSDRKAWIQRQLGVDTVTTNRGYSDNQPWIQRHLGVDIVTVRPGKVPRQAVSISTARCRYIHACCSF